MRLRSKILTFLLIWLFSTNTVLTHLDSRRIHREIKQLQRTADKISPLVAKNAVDAKLFIDLFKKTTELTVTQIDTLLSNITVVARVLSTIATHVEARPNFDTLQDASVTIINVFQDAQGSGVIVKSIDGVSLILTANHVIVDSKYVLIDHASGRYAATVLATDDVRDLALLKVHQEIGTALRIAETISNIGERVYSISSPLGLERVTIDGIFSGSDTTEERTLNIVTLDTLFGSSGGMVTNNKGELIGIISKVVMCPAMTRFNGLEKKERIPATKKEEEEENEPFIISAYYTTTFNLIVTLEDIKFFLLGLVS